MNSTRHSAYMVEALPYTMCFPVCEDAIDSKAVPGEVF